MNVVYYRMVNAGGYGGYIPVNAATAAAAAGGGQGQTYGQSSYSPLPGATPHTTPVTPGVTPGTGLAGALAPTPSANGLAGNGLMVPKLVFPNFSATQLQYMVGIN